MKISYPDHLAGTPDHAEIVFQSVGRTSSAAAPIVLDMAAVRWIAPYGAVTLLLTCRYLTQLTGCPVEIDELRPDVRAYLDRIDLFDVGRAWVRMRQAVDPEFRFGLWPRWISTESVLLLCHVPAPIRLCPRFDA